MNKEITSVARPFGRALLALAELMAKPFLRTRRNGPKALDVRNLPEELQRDICRREIAERSADFEIRWRHEINQLNDRHFGEDKRGL